MQQRWLEIIRRSQCCWQEFNVLLVSDGVPGRKKKIVCAIQTWFMTGWLTDDRAAVCLWLFPLKFDNWLMENWSLLLQASFYWQHFLLA